MPAGIQPTRDQNCIVSFLEDNTAVVHGTAQVINGGSTITLYNGDANTGVSWTASGTKGVSSATSFTYMLS
jgi:hypothetical protein